MRTSVSITLFAASLLASTLAVAAPPPHYRLAEFGGDDSETRFTSVNGVNDLGEATVSIFGPSSGQAYVWHDGQLLPIIGLDAVCGPGSSSSAGGLNDRGQVVVGVFNSNGCSQSVVWQGGKVVEVIGPPPPGYTFVAAGGLNDFGRVFGTVFGNNGVDTEFVWHNGQFTLLPVLPGGATGGPGGFILASGEDSRVPNNFAIEFVLTPVH